MIQRLKLRGPHKYHFQHGIAAEHSSKLWKREKYKMMMMIGRLITHYRIKMNYNVFTAMGLKRYSRNYIKKTQKKSTILIYI